MPRWPYCHFAATQHPACPADLLAVLAERGDEDTQAEVARHPDTSEETFRMLGVSESAMVNAAVVENPRALDKHRAFGALTQED